MKKEISGSKKKLSELKDGAKVAKRYIVNAKKIMNLPVVTRIK
ncbi:hypothetical protein ACIROD_15585 [Peribacillus sp. NPDC101481]